MATYTITSANWNSTFFWNSISHGDSGHTLDFSGLGSGFSVSHDSGSGELVISDGTTSFTVGDVWHTGSRDARLGGATQFESFTTFILPDGSDFYAGSDRSETIDLNGGSDTVFTSDGTDTVTGVDGSDFVNLGDGDEFLSATGGDNTILGGDGDDTLNSDTGSDNLQGGAGADVIDALGGDNTIDGGTGADSITTGAGNDEIVGGSGQDTIQAGAGDDTIFGDGGDTGVSAGTLPTFDFDTVSETGDAGTGVIGSYAVYDNIGTTDEGIVVQARLTVLDADDPNIAIEFNTNSVYLNRDAEADSGSGVTLGFEFFDQATGEPIKITGTFTFQDIDTTAESVTAQSADVVSLGLATAPTTNLTATETGEELGAQSDTTSSGNADQNHWAQFSYSEQQELVFMVTSRGAGTNYAFSTTGFTDAPTVVEATPESQDDYIDGGAGDDFIDGMAGNDTLLGGDGSDTLNGGSEADTIDGGADADVIVVNDGFGADVVIGGETVTSGTDFDTLDFSGLSSGVDVTMTGDEAGFATDGSDTLSFSEIEQVVLTDQNDTFSSDYGPATDGVTVEGGAGDDSIIGTEAADLLDGGADDDTLRGGIGADTVIGGTGNDSLYGNEDDDTILGGEGSDSIFGETGNDLVDGGIGDDTVEGNEGDDTLIGGEGNDWLRGSYDQDALYGGTGDDYLWGGWGDDTFHIENGFGNDTVDAEGVAETTGDVLDLSAVTDSLTIDLTDTNPEIGTVTDGSDTLSFQDIETIVLGSGTDTLLLADGSGVDSVAGFSAPTDLGGGAYGGNDLLDVTALTDAAGNPVSTEDVAVTDTVGDGSGDAILTFPNGESLVLLGVAVSEVQSPQQLNAMGIPLAPGDFIVEGSAFGETIDTGYAGDPNNDFVDNNDGIGGGQDDTILAYGGDDLVLAGLGDDSVLGGTGDDSLQGDSGNDTLDGGDGADVLLGGIGGDLLSGGADADRIVLQDDFGADTITGGETATTGDDNDTLDASAVPGSVTVTYTGDEAGTITDGTDTAGFFEIESLTLGGGDDNVDGTADSAGLNVIADGGSDSLIGGGGDDTLDGGTGADSLTGGAGDDSLTGGDGADTINAGSGDVATGDGGDDVFNVTAGDVSGAGLTITGGETGETGGDTLNITGPAVITPTGAESGTVEWLDGSILEFSEIENINYIPCFTPGTMIKTNKGEVDASQIARGDRVLTRDNGYKRVLWAGTKTLGSAALTACPDLRPIRILAGSLGQGVPERDMLVSPQHRVVMGGAAVELLFGEDEVLVAASHLVGRKGIEQVCPSEGVTYVHFMFNAHELVMSDGAWTESFQPGDLSLAGLDSAQRDELLTLFPELSNTPGREAYTAARASLKADQARILLAA